MAYESFQYDKPDPATDTGITAFDNTRMNLLALRDAIVAGEMTGWNITVTDTNVDGQPESVMFQNQNAVEWVRMTISWNPNGAPATVLLEYANAPGVWVPMGTPAAPNGLLTLSYNATTGLVETGVWS